MQSHMTVQCVKSREQSAVGWEVSLDREGVYCSPHLGLINLLFLTFSAALAHLVLASSILQFTRI